MSHPRFFVALCALVLLLAGNSLDAADKELDLTTQLRDFQADVFDASKAKELGQMLAGDVRTRMRAANQRETKLWSEIKTKADWEKYRDARLQKLRESLGTFPEPPKNLKVNAIRTLDGEGFRIENLVFETRPGLLATANLYLPKDPPKSMPGIIVCPSHHNPRTQGELQDMGMSWARLGCLVLVMDNLGHGERRQHPFVDAGSYPEKFRPTRQDYYFRYNTSLQLYAAGDSLMGWMAWDLMRGVDLLLSKPGIDKGRILMLGSVAGGGDPVAVAGALDSRITAVGPFNFGGPQPESTYPLPADAEAGFNYAGGGSWESTRNLRLSARDGFLPWVIVGGVAPRHLLYGHEFSWDKEHDPVWKRLEKIYGFYDATDKLAGAQGKGTLSGRPPEATHCNNIGPEHRQSMYPALNKWFALGASADKEYKTRRKAEELLCSTAEERVMSRPLYQLAAELGNERAEAARHRLVKLKPEARLLQLRKDWAALLGDVEPKAIPKASAEAPKKVGDVTVERLVLEVEPGILVPTLLLLPPHKDNAKLSVVVAFAQEGKQEFLKKRAEGIAALLKGGAAVCLPDLRGSGETRPGDSRSRGSSATSISASELMLGQTMLGSRLRDLRSVLRYLRERKDLNGLQIAVWGDSFAPANPADRKLEVPLDAEKFPDQAEPLGGLLVLLAALFEPDLQGVYGQGGLVSYQSLLQSPFLYVPHDAVVPGALMAGDLNDVAALAPKAVRLEGLVDGLNRKVSAETLKRTYGTGAQYRVKRAAQQYVIRAEAAPGNEVAAWLLTQLKAE